MAKWRFIRFLSLIIVIFGTILSITAGYFLLESIAYKDWQRSPVTITATQWAPYRFSVSHYGINTQIPELVYSYELQGKEYGHNTISIRNYFHTLFAKLPFMQQSKVFVDNNDPSHSVIVIAGFYTLLFVMVTGLMLVVAGLYMARAATRLNKMKIIEHRFRGVLKKEQGYGDHRRVS